MTSSPTRSRPVELPSLLGLAPSARPAACDLPVSVEHGSDDLWARCYRPDQLETGVVLWAHGGSWTGGSVPDWDEPCRALALSTGWAVMSLDYRLAPRWTYPAPVDDVVCAVRWLLQTITPDRSRPLVAVGGDSAGATLAAAAAVRLRDENVPLAAQLLAYPPLDPECSQPSYQGGATAWPVRSSLLDAWASYRGNAEHPRYLTPWSTDELTGIAPAAIAVGALDPVADDCRVYADRLAGSGVEVALGLFPGVGHGLLFARDRDGGYPVQQWLGQALARLSPTTERTSA